MLNNNANKNNKGNTGNTDNMYNKDQANYDDVTTQLYRGSFVLVVVANSVVVIIVVVVVALLAVTDHIVLSCGQQTFIWGS